MFAQLCEQLAVQVVRLAVAGEGRPLHCGQERCCPAVETSPSTAPLSVMERRIHTA